MDRVAFPRVMAFAFNALAVAARFFVRLPLLHAPLVSLQERPETTDGEKGPGPEMWTVSFYE